MWRFALTAVGIVVWLVYVAFLGDRGGDDVLAYYRADYADPRGFASYLYSPAFEQVTEPLRWLGWDVFRTVWRLAEVAALVVMAGPFAAPLLLVWPVPLEVNMANVNLLMPVVVIAGFRWPAAWAFVLLTKVTPGIGLLWFVVRREWRSLGIALGTTGAIVAVSYVLAPGRWAEWLNLLMTTRGGYGFDVVPLPFWTRRVLASAIVVWGARTDRRWTVIVACWLAVPTTWPSTLSMLVGVLWLRRQTRVMRMYPGMSAVLPPAPASTRPVPALTDARME